VRAGAAPLRVSRPDADVSVELLADATTRHVHVGRIGDWYAPVPALGPACAVTTWIDVRDGTAILPGALPAASAWIVRTAADRCAEGPTGADSFGRARATGPGGTACGPGP
jgi:hypothetical protein